MEFNCSSVNFCRTEIPCCLKSFANKIGDATIKFSSSFSSSIINDFFGVEDFFMGEFLSVLLIGDFFLSFFVVFFCFLKKRKGGKKEGTKENEEPETVE
jgi:hypothetical protein